MTLEKALEHIKYLVSHDTPVQITPTHKKAFTVIKDSVNPDEDKLFNDNLLFGKLYAHNLGLLMDRFDTNIDNAIPHRELHRILNLPFNLIVEILTSKMNDRLRYDLLESVGFNKQKHPNMLTRFERENIFSKLEELLAITCNYEVFMGNPWSSEEVSQGIKSTILKILACKPKN
jgi:hypothetical protein